MSPVASTFRGIKGWLGARLGAYLSQATHVHGTAAATDPVKLMACLSPGDVLLVEGQTRVSVAIKYLTQSTWSHAALYAGDSTGLYDSTGQPRSFLEADIQEGVRAVSVAAFAGLHCRVCRPVGLGAAEIDALIAFVMARLGHRYDLKNVVDLARYFAIVKPTLATSFDYRSLAWHMAVGREARAEVAPVTRLAEVI